MQYRIISKHDVVYFFLIKVDSFKSLELNDLVRSFQASDLVDTLRRFKKMKQNHRKYETYDFA